MALPEPEPGLVISYAYLWHHEHRGGQEKGRKDRPCVIVLTVERASDGATIVTVLPVTHRAPDNPAASIEIPQTIKHKLGLDAHRSWVVVARATNLCGQATTCVRCRGTLRATPTAFCRHVSSMMY